MNLFDSHCHLEDERFEDDRAEVLARMKDAGVNRCILAGSALDSSERIVKLTRGYASIFGVVGVHPHESKTWTEECEQYIRQWIKEERIVGIGEIGLDYYYDLSPRDVQKDVFVRQLLLAHQLGLPVCFHIRDAHGDTIDILRAHKRELPTGVVHCFSGSMEIMRIYLDLGYFISLGGPVTFKNANKLLEVAAAVPEDRLLIETDSPYLAPVPMRGKRNEPTFVQYVAQRIAELRGISAERLADITARNTCHLFGISEDGV